MKDLSNENIWRYNSGRAISINKTSDFRTLSKELNSVVKSKVVVIFPQNVNYKYDWNSYSVEFGEIVKIKDMLPTIMKIISENLFNISGFEISYSKNKTTINNCCYKSDFNFNQVIDDTFNDISKSDNSGKITSMIYNNYILTTLDIFESEEHLKNFILFLSNENQEKENAPDWFNEISFFDDEFLKENKNKNNDEINMLQEKNNEIDGKLEKNNKFKSILYTSGDELVEVVMKILDDMLEYDSSNFIDAKKEDFLIKKDSITFVGEIKGVSSAVANKNVSQLDVHVQSYIDKITEMKSKEVVKGLLIINHQRTKKIEERNEVHQNQIDLAIRNGSLIIESTTLLSLYEKFLQGKIDSKKVIKLLTEKVGILKKEDIRL